MRLQKRKLICSVMGCRNTDTYLIAKNGVMVNTPNICKDCVKAAFEALYPEEAEKLNSVKKTAEETVYKMDDESADEADEPKKKSRKKA